MQTFEKQAIPLLYIFAWKPVCFFPRMENIRLGLPISFLMLAVLGLLIYMAAGSHLNGKLILLLVEGTTDVQTSTD